MSKSLRLMAVTTLSISATSVSLYAIEPTDIEVIEKSLLPKVQLAGTTYKPATIEDRMTASKLPGLSIAVVKDGKLAWTKGYGIANKKTGTVVDSETLFQAGSISKPVAALSALRLVQEDKVDLDKNVNTYLTSWKIPSSDFSKQQAVTLRHLLTHTAGLTVHGFPGYKTGEELPSNTEVLNGEGNTGKVLLDIVPGSKWRYSGGGYTVMEQLVEDVSKKTLEHYTQEAVLDKLGMENSTYQQPLAKNKWSQASAAFNRQGEQIKGDWNNYPEQAAAGLWTTPSDLAKYILAIQHARKGLDDRVIDQNMTNEMLTMHHDAWGLGPELTAKPQGLVFSHGGKNAGFTNSMMAYADKGDGFVIMTNGDSGGAVINELKIAISSFYGWDLAEYSMITPTAFAPELLAKIEGTYAYQPEPKYQFTVKINGDKIDVLDLTDKDTSTFVPTGDNSMKNIESGVEAVFQRNESGEVTGILWGGQHQLNKI